jgi:hypothetical protein
MNNQLKNTTGSRTITRVHGDHRRKAPRLLFSRARPGSHFSVRAMSVCLGIFYLILKNLILWALFINQWLSCNLADTNSKSEARNSKQSLITKIPNIRNKTVTFDGIPIFCFGHLGTCPGECRLLAALL